MVYFKLFFLKLEGLASSILFEKLINLDIFSTENRKRIRISESNHKQMSVMIRKHIVVNPLEACS